MPINDLRNDLASALAGEGQQTNGLEQEVIAGYMTLTPAEKKVLLKVMNSEFGAILAKVLPDDLGELIAEAVNTAPERIGAGTTLPLRAG